MEKKKPRRKKMKIREAAEHLGVSTESLRRWDKEGIIKADRSPLGHRLFTPEAILQIQQIIKLRSLERRKSD
jgi:DNA-binding transcriptional MerR regulator